VSCTTRGTSLLLLALSLASLSACGSLSRDASLRKDGLPPAPPRPRDPWVMRCVLDGRPRMLVVALSDDLWLAYDTTTCTLAKAWRGDVNFDGPVYTTAHGPQPTSRGQDLHDPLAGSSWGPTEAFFRGYTLIEGRITLHWELAHGIGYGQVGRGVHFVDETPEVAHDARGRVSLVRKFALTAPPFTSVHLSPGNLEGTLPPGLSLDWTGDAEWQSSLILDGKGSHDGRSLRLGAGTGVVVVTYPDTGAGGSTGSDR
jgi:hypothetical protein